MRRLPELKGDVRFDVGPPFRPSCAASTTATVENAAEDIAKTAVRRKSPTGSSSGSEDVREVEVFARRPKPAGETGASASTEASEPAGAEHGFQLVIFLTLVFVTEDVVGVRRLFEALKGDDLDAIKAAVEKLSTESQEMGNQIYQAQANEGATQADGASESADDNVVDAEVVDEDDNTDATKDGDK